MTNEPRRAFGRRRWRLLLAAACLVAGGGTALYTWWGEETAPGAMGSGERGPDSPRLDLSGFEPLLEFPDAYRRGRSRWFAARFAEDRRRLREASVPAGKPEVDVMVRREAFTRGAWITELDPAGRALREVAESGTVEVTVEFLVPGVEPEKLAVFLSASGVTSRVEEKDRDRVEVRFPPLGETPPCLQELPPLGPSRLLRRVRWARAMAQPTDVWFVDEVRRRDGLWCMTFSAWANCPAEGSATVYLATGQYAVDAREGGSLVRFHSYYRGQEIPPFLDALVRLMTRSYYSKLVAAIRQGAPGWEPDPPARRWWDRLRGALGAGPLSAPEEAAPRSPAPSGAGS